MFLVKNFLHFSLSLSFGSMFSMASSTHEILSSLFCILVMFATMTSDLFPRFFTSWVVSLYDFFIVSMSIFRPWMMLFNYFLILVVFFWKKLKDFCVSSLRDSGCFPVSCISLRELFKPLLKSSIIIMRYDFNSESCFSGMLGYPGLGVVGDLNVDYTNLPWALLLMFLHLCLAL